MVLYPTIGCNWMWLSYGDGSRCSYCTFLCLKYLFTENLEVEATLSFQTALAESSIKLLQRIRRGVDVLS